jgi:hypothetical protein
MTSDLSKKTDPVIYRPKLKSISDAHESWSYFTRHTKHLRGLREAALSSDRDPAPHFQAQDRDTRFILQPAPSPSLMTSL